MNQQEIEHRIKELELELSVLKSAQVSQIPKEEFLFSDLVDCSELQDLMNYFYELVGLGIGIIDRNKKVLVATGWQDICMKFHRVHPETCKKCIESSDYITKMQNAKEPMGYKCKNGMWDIAFPIIIDGKILAGVYFGQFFFDDEIIDFNFFEKQAEKYGFDKKEYLTALKKVPIISHQRVKNLITLYAKIAQIIADLGYQKLIIKREQIQERLISQQKLIESEKLLNETGRISKVGGWKVDLKNQILTWTKEVYHIHEVPQTYQPTFEDAINFYEGDSKMVIEKLFREAIFNGKSFEQDLELVTKKGNRLIVRAIGSVQKNENGVSEFIAGTFQDITQQKQVEDKLYQSNLCKDRFLTILAHDLKNPFVSILGFADLLLRNLREYDEQKIEKFLTYIHQTAYQTYNLLEDVLLWSKSQSGKLTAQFQQINFHEVYAEVINNVKIYADSKGIKITNCVIDEVILWADVNMLKVILRNLISNAIKFSSDNGEIKIFIESDSTNVIISISDNGIGIENDKLENIWDFSTLYIKQGTANEKGTGFGLVFCKELVEKHGGTIWVESEYRKGSVFKFTLPLYKQI